LAFGPYEGVWRDLIHLLKYDRVRSVADVIARCLGAQIPDDLVAQDPLLVPVPLHKSKFRLRGFNQAEEIARSLRRLCGFHMNSYVLVRRRATSSQTGMSPLQRRDNVRGAFAVRKRARRELAGRSVILVDDVFTTGATANECARVLLRAGAAHVSILTAARVTRMTPQPVGAALAPLATGTHAANVSMEGTV